ncbi:MAG TPA: hypothetical protein VFV33_10750, partial [Gemmatimonadaceae bacterium]|nr:hypothetical protein [Gemmatimonadaceae bacterium]
MRFQPTYLAFAAATLAACAPVPSRTRVAPVHESRIVSSAEGRDVGYAVLADRAGNADVVFFGENHGDPATHRAELALLAEIGSRH